MAENNVSKWTSPRRRKPIEHTSVSDAPTEDKPDSSVPTADDNLSICDSVEQMNISNDLDDQIDDVIDNLKIPEKVLSSRNVPEKIIIVYDCVREEDDSGFTVNNQHCSTGDMIKKGLTMFLYNKHEINKVHQFALVVLDGDGALLLKDFTNDVSAIVDALEDVQTCGAKGDVSLDGLFDMVASKVVMKQESVPTHVYRVVFTYCRSKVMPLFDRRKVRVGLLECPYFTFDVLTSLEAVGGDNNCTNINKLLQGIDTKGCAYFFSVYKSSTELYRAFAKLLGHPLQRPKQIDANYSINIGED